MHNLDRLKKAGLIFVEIKYDKRIVKAFGWYSDILRCFVFHSGSEIFYYHHDTNELERCIDLWRLYRIRKIGFCGKIEKFEISVTNVLEDFN